MKLVEFKKLINKKQLAPYFVYLTFLPPGLPWKMCALLRLTSRSVLSSYSNFYGANYVTVI